MRIRDWSSDVCSSDLMSRAVLTMESPLPARRPPLAPGEDPGTPLTLVSDYEPAGDQPKAIAELVAALQGGEREQVLLGVTGSGKPLPVRSDARREGKECVSTCRSRWSTNHKKK